MSGEDELLLSTPFEVLKLRVRRFSEPLTSEQQALAHRAAFSLRVGLEEGDPGVLRVAHGLDSGLFGASGLGFDRVSPAGPGPLSLLQREALARRLSAEIEAGRVLVEREEIESLAERAFELPFDLPPLPPPPKEGTTTFFEVRFVDEIGQGISGVGVEFEVDGEFRDVTTNAAGVALVENTQSSTAAVSITEVSELESVLDPRWTKLRPGKPPKEANTTRLRFARKRVGPLGVKAVVPNTVVIEPPRGRLFVELFDKKGHVRHSKRPYTIEGPQSFSGTTDELGTLAHDDVFPGDYKLKFTLEFFEGKDKQTDDYESPLVVLGPDEAKPETRMLGAVPTCVLARLKAFFNTNKTFLLPTALPGVRALRKLYLENSPAKLLVVGHADTKGGTAYNDQLSLERAEATIAYLKDDVDGWLKFYEAGVAKQKRWGSPEDRMMLISMPGFRDKPEGEDAVRWYQRTRELDVDGNAGPKTRKKLVAEYMSLDGASLSDFEIDVEATAHGCGEHFPLDDEGESVDSAPEDEKRDPIDRRVELFFFDAEFGVVPAPPGKNSKAGSPEYLAWHKGATRTIELEASDFEGPKVIFVELADAHFRSDSAVVLPEGENPDQSGQHQALTSPGVIATVLRFNEERPGRKLLVAGHTDTSAGDEHNQELSELRAKVALALLKGDRETFRNTSAARHKTGDVKQILSWVSRAFKGFDCDPGKIDDNAATAVEPIRRFQEAYNQNKADLGIEQANLSPDGAAGSLTWGAFFDCYELALQQELDEDEAGLLSLRKKLEFADPKRESLGFGEHFPLEELGVDNYRSQLNRRVEILFFEPLEEPDLEHAQQDPETSELYLPGTYVRTPIGRDPSERVERGDIHMQLLDDLTLEPLTITDYSIGAENGEELVGVTDAAGVLRHRDVPVGDYVLSVAGRSETCAAIVLTHSVDEPQIRALPSDDKRTFELRVHDASRAPLANAECRLTILGETLTELSNDDGIATFELPLICPESADVEWSDGDNVFKQKLFLDCTEGDIEAVAPARLENLGYPAIVDLDLAVAAFQADYGLSPIEQVAADGSLPAQVLDELRRIWDEKLCDATRPGKG